MTCMLEYDVEIHLMRTVSPASSEHGGEADSVPRPVAAAFQPCYRPNV
jgi:hypothetical protein